MADLVPAHALGNLPAGLRAELLAVFDSIVTNYRLGRWEPSELNGGKLCEVVYTILRGYADGSYPAASKKPKNMLLACAALEQEPSTLPRSVRVSIPRVLIALYEIRNNRSVGHVGGEVDPNHMDVTAVVAMARWVVAELIRVFHAIDVAAAQLVVEGLVNREIPMVWTTGRTRRVLDPTMPAAKAVLVFAYSHNGPVRVKDLLAWTEYKNGPRFRKEVLGSLHEKRLIEFARLQQFEMADHVAALAAAWRTSIYLGSQCIALRMWFRHSTALGSPISPNTSTAELISGLWL